VFAVAEIFEQMPSAGELLGASGGVENFMITDVISPATHASTEITHSTNPQFRAPPTETQSPRYQVEGHRC